MWVRACKVLGADGLASDPRFSDNASRVENRDELSRELETLLQRESSKHWIALLTEGGVPAAEVRGVDEVLASDQVAALGSLQHLDHPHAGDTVAVAPPLRFDRLPLAYPSAALLLGADTATVLAGLGYNEVEMDKLVVDGAVGPV